MTNDYIDLFAGAGGWDIAAERLGLAGLGVELNAAACATRRAAGLATFEGTVTSPRAENHYAALGAQGLIASPPCQTFSAAGKGAGRSQMELILLALKRWAWNPEDFSDPRTALVLEPARWILNRIGAGQPYKWVALEQVPTCLPIWHAYAEMLEDLGYFTAVGFLHAEQYGVPQTRKRAILIAHLERPVSLPTPTHSKYYPRNKTKLDPGVEKWVSMAEALGWGGDFEVASNYNTGGVPGKKGIRAGEDPAACVTSKVNRNFIRLRNGAQRNATVRDVDEPAPTLLSSADNGDTRWVFRSDNRPNSAVRELEDPAPTILGNGERGTHAAWLGNEESRRVTVREAAVLQSFPADHPWFGTKTQQYQQVGNAYPVLLAEAVLRQVVDL